jgi:hypothetical protein
MVSVLNGAGKWRQIRECQHVRWVKVVNVQVRHIDLVVPAPLDPGFGLSAGNHSVLLVGESEEQANHSSQDIPLNFTVSLLDHDPGNHIVIETQCCLETLLVCG